MLNKIKNIKIWLKVMRINQGFFLVNISAILVAYSLIKYHHPEVSIDINIILLVASICFMIHIGADTINEYYDFISDNHKDQMIKTPFNGGTQVLEKKLLPAKKVLLVSYIFFFIGLLLSIALVFITQNTTCLIFIFLGLFSAWAYSSPPFYLSRKAMGEILIFLNNGLFVIALIYTLMLNNILFLEVLLSSLFLGLLGMNIIITNEIPDYEDDKRINKKNLVVVFGIKKMIQFRKLITILAFLVIVIGIILKSFPELSIITLIIPVIYYKSIFKVKEQNFNTEQQVFKICKDTIDLKLQSGFLLIASLLV